MIWIIISILIGYIGASYIWVNYSKLIFTDLILQFPKVDAIMSYPMTLVAKLMS